MNFRKTIAYVPYQVLKAIHVSFEWVAHSAFYAQVRVYAWMNRIQL